MPGAVSGTQRLSAPRALWFSFVLLVLCYLWPSVDSQNPPRQIQAARIPTVRHERTLVWAQSGSPPPGGGVSRLVGVSGDPDDWLPNRTATTRYVTAPSGSWRFRALAFNFRERSLFWSDAGNKDIRGLRLDGGTAAFPITSGISSEVRGLASDWIHNNLYWTDSLYNWVAMAPAAAGTSLVRVVIETGLENPVGIAVYPSKSLLFWSDCGENPKIEMSDLTGLNRSILVVTGLDRPMGLVVDYNNNRLYWVDSSTGKVESVDLQGQERRVHFTDTGTNFFGIALYRSLIFITEQKKKQLFIVRRAEQDPIVPLTFNLGASPYGIVMYDEAIQPQSPDVCAQAGCSQLCTRAAGGRHQCLCASGFQLAADGKSCTDSGIFSRPQLIYSMSSAICRFSGNLADMRLHNISLDTQCFLTRRRGALALAVHVEQRILYFAENRTRTISLLSLDEGGNPTVVVGGTGIVEGLAVDWLTGNLYWTDSSEPAVMVARSDGRFQVPLISDQLEHPRALAIDAVNRWLYWTDVGSWARLERCRLDGSGREVVVGETVLSPNDLFIDYRTNRLYWTDSGTGSVDSVDLAGSHRRRDLAQPGSNLCGLAVYQDYLVWTDRDSRNGIHAGLLRTGHKIRGIVHPGIGQAADLLLFDTATQPPGSGACSMDNGGCAQLCLPRGPHTFTCRCSLGFEAAADNVSCKTDPLEDNFLLFTDTYRKQIYQMSITSGDIRALPLTGPDNPIALDYDSRGHHVIWTDVAAKVIKKAGLNGTGEMVVKRLAQDAVPDGVAVLSELGLVFYTDTGRKVVGVTSLDGSQHRVLVSRGLDNPRAIALDPTKGFMYWTDWGARSRIEKAAMDGSQRRHLVDTGVGGWPNGLAVDTTGGRLYWCDARRDRVWSCDLEGREQRLLFWEQNSHFFGLAAMAGILYYTDWNKKTIMTLRAGAEGEMWTSAALGQKSFGRINDIHAYSSQHQIKDREPTPCSVGNGGCSHFCLPVPSGYVCECPDGFLKSWRNPRQCVDGPDNSFTPSSQITMTRSEIEVPTTSDYRKTSPPTRSVHVTSTTASTSSPWIRTITYSSVTRRRETDSGTNNGVTQSHGGGHVMSVSSTTPLSGVTHFTPTVQKEVTVSNKGDYEHDGDIEVASSTTTKLVTMWEWDILSSTQSPTVEYPDDSAGSTVLDELGLSMLALVAIVAGGVVLMCLIIISAVLVYRKLDPDRGSHRRGSYEPPLSSLSDVYELPRHNNNKSRPTTAPPSPPDRYATLHERYFPSPSLEQGLANLGFPNNNSPDMYEEILEETSRQPSFSTFK